MAVIVLTDNDVYTVPEQAETGVVLLAVLLITYIFLRFSDFILRVIGQQGAGRPRAGDGNYSRLAGGGNCADSAGGGRLGTGESTESLTWLDSAGAALETLHGNAVPLKR